MMMMMMMMMMIGHTPTTMQASRHASGRPSFEASANGRRDDAPGRGNESGRRDGGLSAGPQSGSNRRLDGSRNE